MTFNKLVQGVLDLFYAFYQSSLLSYVHVTDREFPLGSTKFPPALMVWIELKTVKTKTEP